MIGLTWDGTAEPISRDQILRSERGQGKIILFFPAETADHEQDWQACRSMQCTICFHSINSYWCCTCSSGFMPAVFSFTCHPECQTVPEGWGRPAQRLHTKWAPLDSCWCPFALQPLHDQVLSATMAPNTRCTLDPDVDVGVIRLSSLMTSHGRADSMPLARIDPPKAREGGINDSITKTSDQTRPGLNHTQ